jgi:thiamine-monophosphate kinase
VASEFELIARYFKRGAPSGMLGVGDDCALLDVPAGQRLAVSTDMLLEGRHFFAGTDARALGHKALAVNLSDLAAMGAEPLGCLLGLALPQVDEAWLAAFAEGFHAISGHYGCPLLGGDTTRSSSGIVLSVTVFGSVPPDRALRRDAACDGDDIWVSGALGAADIAYRLLDGQLPADASMLAATRAALERPTPRVELGAVLRGVAHAAIDISDGLLQDLGHILAASGVGAELQYADLPVAPGLGGLHQAPLDRAVMGGGDVYELCFTAPSAMRDRVKAAAVSIDVPVTRIGRIRAEPGLLVLDGSGRPHPQPQGGFDHFQAS